MGIDKICLQAILKEGKKKKFQGNVVTLGKQDIFFSLDQLQEISDRLGYSLFQLNEELSLKENLKKQKYISDVCLFKNLGFSDVKSLDCSEYEKADYIFDLNNNNLPECLHNKFDVIIDGGTIEHIFNLPNALNNIFKMLKNNGRIFHYSPSVNYIDHGFYMFSPTFFWDFYTENKFEINTIKLSKHPFAMNTYWKSVDYFPGMINFFNFRPQKKHLYIVECVVTKNENSTGDKTPQQFCYSNMLWNNNNISVTPLIGDVDSKNVIKKITFFKNRFLNLLRKIKKYFIK